MLKGKCIILGVTGGIAAYKSVELLRELVKGGADVRVVMTRNAAEFVTPLTFQSLSGHRVTTELFDLDWEDEIAHIALAQTSDLVVIAPATANIIGKIANGIGDDFLSTLMMAVRCPVLLAPAMNSNMWENPVVRQNLEKLRRFRYEWVDPDFGDLACGVTGPGRMAEMAEIIERMEDLLTEKDLTGQRIVVTAGPTVEGMDPVRYITNRSSGKMGYAMAKMARRRGAEVVLVSGPSLLPPPRKDIVFVSVRGAQEMKHAVFEHYGRCSVIIMSAAVADYRPKEVSIQKLKKAERDVYVMELERNPDILMELGRNKGDRIVVGFAAETEDVVENAQAKLHEKHADLFVANDVTLKGAGFEVDTNIVTLVDRRGRTKKLPLMHKDEVAHLVLNQVVKLIRRRKRGKRKGEGQVLR